MCWCGPAVKIRPRQCSSRHPAACAPRRDAVLNSFKKLDPRRAPGPALPQSVVKPVWNGFTVSSCETVTFDGRVKREMARYQGVTIPVQRPASIKPFKDVYTVFDVSRAK